MKGLIIFFSLFALTTVVQADRFQSRIYEIDRGLSIRIPHLVKFLNGRVVFLPFEEGETLNSLYQGLDQGDVLELEVDEDQNLISAMTIETGSGPLTRERHRGNEERVMATYRPTIVKGDETARSIFSKMRKGWQNESQCYNRAHVWTYEAFKREQLNSLKVFLFFTNRYIRNYHYKWWFHVSPMIMVQEGDNTRRRVMDRRYTSGPLMVKTWTDIFIKSKKSCPVVKTYSDYSDHQQKEDCYLIPVSQYYWQPMDIERFENNGFEKTNYIDSEIDWAYEEAF